jgi:hypothetical protein
MQLELKNTNNNNGSIAINRNERIVHRHRNSVTVVLSSALLFFASGEVQIGTANTINSIDLIGNCYSFKIEHPKPNFPEGSTICFVSKKTAIMSQTFGEAYEFEALWHITDKGTIYFEAADFPPDGRLVCKLANSSKIGALKLDCGQNLFGFSGVWEKLPMNAFRNAPDRR